MSRSQRERRNGRASGSALDTLMAETLYSKHAELLTIFRFLDTNNNGKLSRDEWTVGVDLLNRRLSPSEALPDAAVRGLPATAPLIARYRPLDCPLPPP